MISSFMLWAATDNGRDFAVVFAPINCVARPALAMQDEAIARDYLDEFGKRALQAGHGMTKPASE